MFPSTQPNEMKTTEQSHFVVLSPFDYPILIANIRAIDDRSFIFSLSGGHLCSIYCYFICEFGRSRLICLNQFLACVFNFYFLLRHNICANIRNSEKGRDGGRKRERESERKQKKQQIIARAVCDITSIDCLTVFEL